MKNEESALIILPLPPKCLSPNSPPGTFGGRMRKAVASKRYREAAKTAALSCGIESGPWRKATIQATFYHKCKRRRDDINHLAMLKPAYDGIVDSGLLFNDDSDHLTTLPAEFKVDRELSRVELRIVRVQAAPVGLFSPQ